MWSAVRVVGEVAMVLVPICTGTALRVAPSVLRSVPVAAWVVWLLVSFVVSLEAPAIANYFTSSENGVRGAIRFTRWCIVIGVINAVSALAVLCPRS